MDINDIVKGGDERISLNENGLNKYHGNQKHGERGVVGYEEIK